MPDDSAIAGEQAMKVQVEAWMGPLGRAGVRWCIDGPRKWGLLNGDPVALPSYVPDIVGGKRGAPQLYSHPAHWHARNLLRRVPVVGSIDPPGRKTSGH
jgi:hypothetical protein